MTTNNQLNLNKKGNTIIAAVGSGSKQEEKCPCLNLVDLFFESVHSIF